MKKITILLILVMSISYGAKEKKGQRYYLNRCAGCHGSGKMWGNVATIQEWKDFFPTDIKEMKEFHKDSPKVLNYLNSKDFKREKNRISRFLQEFASDSESIPSCNN